MMDTDKKRRLTALLGALLFSGFVVGVLFCFTLKYWNPPPPEQGVEINAGDLTDMGNAMMGDAGGEEQPENSAKAVDDDEDVVTTNDHSPLTQKKTQPKKTQNKKKQEQVTDNDALFPKKSNGSGKGTGSGSGQGDNGNGGGGNGVDKNGNGWSLKGRTAKALGKPKTNKQETGKIVVKIGVDQDGNVVSANAGAKGTTIGDTNLWRVCEQAARKSKFSERRDGADIQYGTITYNFVQ